MRKNWTTQTCEKKKNAEDLSPLRFISLSLPRYLRQKYPYQDALAGDLHKSSIYVNTVLLTLFPCQVVLEKSIATVSIVSPVCVTWVALMTLRRKQAQDPVHSELSLLFPHLHCFLHISRFFRDSIKKTKTKTKTNSRVRGDEEVNKPYLLSFCPDSCIKSWQTFFTNIFRVPERFSFSACRQFCCMTARWKHQIIICNQNKKGDAKMSSL